MGIMDYVKRGALAVGTGGLSEVPGAKDVLQNIGTATGLISPSDNVDETAILKSTEEQAAEIYRRSLEEQDRVNALQLPTSIAGAGRTAVDTGQYFEPGTARGYTAANIADTRDVQMAPVDTRIDAPQIGPAALQGAVGVGATQIDPLANQLRGEQLKAARAIAEGPGAASSQFKAALDATTAQQMGLAAGARGADRAEARREAILAIGQQGIGAASQAAAAAAQEEMAKRVAASQALTGIRATDTQTSLAQAQLDSERQQLQARLDAARLAGDQQAVNEITQAQAQLGLRARESTVGYGLDAAKTRAAVAGDTAGRQDVVNATRAGSQDAAARFGAESTNARESEIAAGKTAYSVGAGAARTAASAGGVDREQARMTAETGLRQGNEQLRQSGVQGAMGAATNATNTTARAAEAKIGAATGQQSREDAAGQRLVSGLSTVGAAAVGKPSDERCKTDIREISPEEIRDVAEQMRAVSFRYRPGVEDGGAQMRAGTTAQSLEKTPLGRQFVSEGPDGMKQVHYSELAALLAAEALRSKKGRA
jgi:hypothetical protein